MNIGLPAKVDISLYGGITTSAAVSLDDGHSVLGGTSYNGNAGTYSFIGTLIMPDGVAANPNNLEASVSVIVRAGNNPVSETTPAAVTIIGTTKVGNTLSAIIMMHVLQVQQ